MNASVDHQYILRKDIYSLTFFGYIIDEQDRKLAQMLKAKLQKGDEEEDETNKFEKVIKLVKHERNAQNFAKCIVLFTI